jgi:hypothetical protein
MRDCKRVWSEVLILFLCLVVTANPLRAEAQQGDATPSHRGVRATSRSG